MWKCLLLNFLNLRKKKIFFFAYFYFIIIFLKNEIYKNIIIFTKNKFDKAKWMIIYKKNKKEIKIAFKATKNFHFLSFLIFFLLFF